MRQQEILDFADFLETRYEEAKTQPERLEPLPMLSGLVPHAWKDEI